MATAKASSGGRGGKAFDRRMEEPVVKATQGYKARDKAILNANPSEYFRLRIQEQKGMQLSRAERSVLNRRGWYLKNRVAMQSEANRQAWNKASTDAERYAVRHKISLPDAGTLIGR